MGAPRVVVVEHDAWILDLLENGLREHHFVVVRTTGAADALVKARDLPPDCILCDVGLPEEDGYALVSTLRALAPPVSMIPVALLAAEDDRDARIRAFEAGADVLLTRPFRIEEVVAQLGALVQLADRMRSARTSLVDSLGPGSASVEEASFRADLATMPLSSLLMLLEIERKSGTIELRSPAGRASLQIADGVVEGATLDGSRAPVVEVARAALAWSAGRVLFRASPPRPRPPGAKTARALVAEAQRASGPVRDRPSAPRLAAIPPPPGRRKPLDPLEPPSGKGVAAAPAPSERQLRAVALEEQPTVRVDVPNVGERK
jgi:DNA-binding response OmpR family regulator